MTDWLTCVVERRVPRKVTNCSEGENWRRAVSGSQGEKDSITGEWGCLRGERRVREGVEGELRRGVPMLVENQR